MNNKWRYCTTFKFLTLLIQKGIFYMHTAIRKRITDIQEICRHHKVISLHIFGSAAVSGTGDVNDFDFIVAFDEMEPVEYTEQYFSLLESLESILPNKIDLITVRSLKNPFFIESVEKTKVSLYAA